jgi:hypothetical protein
MTLHIDETANGSHVHGFIVSPEYEHIIDGNYVRSGAGPFTISVLRTTRHPYCQVSFSGVLAVGSQNGQWVTDVTSQGGGCGLDAGFKDSRKWTVISPECPTPPSGTWRSNELQMSTTRDGCDFKGSFNTPAVDHEFRAVWQGGWHYMFTVLRTRRDHCQAYMWGTLGSDQIGTGALNSVITKTDQGCGLPLNESDARVWTKQ